MTTSLGKTLLAEAETDPLGWSYLDIEKLLAAWGVTKALSGADTAGYRTVAHQTVQGFSVTYPLAHELSPKIVSHICHRIRELERLL